MKRCLVALVILFAIPLAAQQPAPRPPAPPATPGKPAAPAPPQAPSPPQAPAPPAVDPEVGGQPVNIRVDVSVIDQTATDAAVPKTLMVMLADRSMGRTRAAFQDRSIAVDARPTLVDGRIRVNLTIQSDANPNFGPPAERDHTIIWRNSFSLLLENGKPLLALETLDAVTKRKMSIEVKATIQK
jgi:hypothetical protein